MKAELEKICKWDRSVDASSLSSLYSTHGSVITQVPMDALFNGYLTAILNSLLPCLPFITETERLATFFLHLFYRRECPYDTVLANKVLEEIC